jgi:hypothetical protein
MSMSMSEREQAVAAALGEISLLRAARNCRKEYLPTILKPKN